MKKGKWAVFNTCDAPVVFKKFFADNINKAKLLICGLGFFECFINSKSISDDMFVPAQTDYEERKNKTLAYPLDDIFSHRIYYMEYDVSEFICEGENEIEIHLGNGWYNQKERTIEGKLDFGNPKLWFELEIENQDGKRQMVVSDDEMKWKKSNITFNNLFFGEVHDFCCDTSKVFECEFTDAPDSRFLKQTCPADKIIRTIKPKFLKTVNGKKIYDAKENIAGYVRCMCKGKVTLRFGDELFNDGSIKFFHCGGDEQIQSDTCITDDKERYFEPKFVWHAFRYFEMESIKIISVDK